VIVLLLAGSSLLGQLLLDQLFLGIRDLELGQGAPFVFWSSLPLQRGVCVMCNMCDNNAGREEFRIPKKLFRYVGLWGGFWQ